MNTTKPPTMNELMNKDTLARAYDALHSSTYYAESYQSATGVNDNRDEFIAECKAVGRDILDAREQLIEEVCKVVCAICDRMETREHAGGMHLEGSLFQKPVRMPVGLWDHAQINGENRWCGTAICQASHIREHFYQQRPIDK